MVVAVEFEIAGEGLSIDVWEELGGNLVEFENEVHGPVFEGIADAAKGVFEVFNGVVNADVLGVEGEGFAVLGDGASDAGDFLEGRVFADEAVKAFTVVDGEFFGERFGRLVEHGFYGVVEVVGVLVGIDPGSVESSGVVVRETGNVNPGI